MRTQSNRLQLWALLVFAGFAVGVAFVRGPGPRDTVRVVGLVLAVAGLLGVIYARYTLGRSFSVTAKATELVTGGLYARIRNPIYVSGLVMIAGLILIVRIHLLWLALAALVVVQILRARAESRVLETRFGEAYRRYREQTWF